MKKILFAIILSLSITMPAFAETFPQITELESAGEIACGVIVRNDGKCADIQSDDLKEWLNVYWNFADYDLVVAPFDAYTFDDYYIKLWNKDKTKAFVVYPHIGIVAGRFGEPYFSHGGMRNNYVWYLPYIGNARNALYIANTKLFKKYLFEDYKEIRDVTDEDKAVIPQNNLLSLDGSSDWAKQEISNAAAANLMVYELSGKYQENITRYEFCDLIYRLVATEFNPDSDSRIGQWSVIENVIDERKIRNEFSSVSFSDVSDDKISFLAATGIIYGEQSDIFNPNGSLTREQAATILYRTAEFLGNKTIPKISKKIYYKDETKISDWALTAVKSMNEMKIMQGVNESEFSPQSGYTVEQAIATMLRLYECL